MFCKIHSIVFSEGKECSGCKRDRVLEAQWKEIRGDAMKTYFTPRINRDLDRLSIHVEEEDTKQILNGGGLFLYGDPGTGKTLYACAVLLEVIKQRTIADRKRGGPDTFMFVTTANLFSSIKADFDKDTIGEISGKGALIIDDLDLQRNSVWEVQTLLQIVNNRYEEMRPTIITSNYGLRKLAEVDDRLPSRICGMCCLKKFSGKDYRVGK